MSMEATANTSGVGDDFTFKYGEREGDNVQSSTVSKNEEQSAEKPDSAEDSTEEKLPNMEEDGNQDHLVKQSELTEEKLTETKTQIEKDVTLPDHHSLSTEPSGSTEETIRDSSDPVIPDEDHGGKITENDQQQSQPFADSLLLDVLNSEEDGPNQDDRETSSAEHGSAYTTSCEEYSLLLEQLTVEHANAVEHSKKLQMRLAPVLAKKPREEMERVTQGELHAKSYEECLDMITELKLNMKEDQETAERQTDELKTQAEERLSKVDREWRELLSLKKDVAVTVLSRRMNRSDAVAKVESALASEEKNQEELTRLRLQNFRMEDRIRRLELEISEADRNATNPFQREYEKLHTRRTEQKKHREKRHKEALRVQRRVERGLEMVSNVKHRLHHTETQVQHQLQKLAQVDAILAQHRDKLASVKQARAGLQRDNARLKEQCGLLGNEVLLRDYDYTKQANAALEEKLQELRCRQADLEFYLGRRKARFQTI